MLTKPEIAVVLRNELEAAIAANVAADGGRRALALGFYDGTLPANDDPQGSKHREAVSLDVADMTEAVYAQLAPALQDVGGVEFEALSADDEAQAQEETAIVRSMLIDGQNSEGGFISFTEAIKNALLMRTGTLALWVERTESRMPERWENVPALGVGQIIEPAVEGQRIEHLNVELEERDDGSLAPEGEGTYTLTFDRVDVDKRLALGCIRPEDFVTSSLEERDPNRARFCADRIVTTRARLISEGFDRAAVLKLVPHDPEGYEGYLERSQSASTIQFDAAQAATETVEVWRCYPMLAESKESPEAARYRVYFQREGSVVLSEPERVGRVCYAVGNVMIYPHRLDGVSLFDRIAEVQELKTNALRGWVENLHKVNRPRLGIDESLVNLADAMDATLDYVRVKGPNAIGPIATMDAGPSIAAFLGYQDQARSERGGASLDMQTSSAQIATNQTASGIERQYSVKEQLAATMARTFAETALRTAFQIAHYLLRTQWGGPVNVKIGGAWKQADPAKWRPRNGVSVRVGQSHSERMQKGAALAQVMQWQTAAMQAGKVGVLTDDAKVFNAAYDWIAASQLRSPERYLIDPSSPGAKQAAKQAQQQGQMAKLAEGEAARAVLMLEKYKVDMDSLGDMIREFNNLVKEEARLIVDAENAVEAAAASVAIQPGMEATGAQMGEAAVRTTRDEPGAPQ